MNNEGSNKCQGQNSMLESCGTTSCPGNLFTLNFPEKMWLNKFSIYYNKYFDFRNSCLVECNTNADCPAERPTCSKGNCKTGKNLENLMLWSVFLIKQTFNGTCKMQRNTYSIKHYSVFGAYRWVFKLSPVSRHNPRRSNAHASGYARYDRYYQ